VRLQPDAHIDELRAARRAEILGLGYLARGIVSDELPVSGAHWQRRERHGRYQQRRRGSPVKR